MDRAPRVQEHRIGDSDRVPATYRDPQILPPVTLEPALVELLTVELKSDVSINYKVNAFQLSEENL